MNRLNLRLSDGRNLEYAENGIESNAAIIIHSGTSGDISGWQTWLDALAARGVRAIAFNRSGYSGSTAMPTRITIDVAHDITQLVDALRLEKFVSAGLSGGGQHAIATGIDPRCVGVVTIGSLAPFAELGQRFYEGMQQVDIDEYADALTDIKLLVKRFQGWTESGVEANAAGSAPSENDARAMQRATWGVLMDSMSYTMNNGWEWVADDYSSYLKPWGFDPRDIAVPVRVWQAGLDLNVPPVHGRWLAENIPGAVLRLVPDESHLGLVVNYENEIMDDAVALLQA
jgi:pimeloyl-ACP methyl ester carboxylesterase